MGTMTRHRILLVEDDETMIKLLRSVLELRAAGADALVGSFAELLALAARERW